MKKLLKVVGFSVLFFLVLIVSIGLYSLHKSSTFDDFLLMTDCSATGNSGHSLNQDCDRIQSY